MFPVYLIAGAIAFSLFGKKRKTYTKSIAPSNGIIFKCNSIQVVDKSKFYNTVQTMVKQNLENKNLAVAEFAETNFTTFVLTIFEQLNKSCYTKFNKKILTSQEKISIMIYLSEILNAFEAIIPLELYTEFDQKSESFIKYCESWMRAEQEAHDFPNIYENFKITYKYP